MRTNRKYRTTEAVAAVLKWMGFGSLAGLFFLLGLADDTSSEDPRGEALVGQYCGSCHLPPPPHILPQKSWPFVIDWMGNYLGIQNLKGGLADLVHPGRVPPGPMVGKEDLEAIRSYFVSRAP